jgi:Abortive infection alpha
MKSQTTGDTLKFGISPSSVSVEVKGSAASRAGHAFLDAISPFTNGLGFLGDALGVKRQEASMEALVRARRRLEAEGITKGNIPPKILLPWVDGSSLELDNKEGLTEAWAGLFVRAVKSSDAVIVSYIDTLKKIGKIEAELLHFFATDTSPGAGEWLYSRIRGSHLMHEDNQPIRSVREKIARVIDSGDIEEADKLFDIIGMQEMRQVILYEISGSLPRPTPYFRKNEHAVSNLEHLGLVQLHNTAFEKVDITWFEISKYGFDFIWACEGVRSGSDSRAARAKK